jgi:uncharacterized C2H2 Zn-finger protein
MVQDLDHPYRCDACGRTFTTEEELVRHVHVVGLVD